MSDRTAKVTQADLERLIRAAKAQGLAIMSIVARPDGYAIETTPRLVTTPVPAPAKRKPVL